MSDLPDTGASRVLLIGVHTYQQLTDLPAVARNLDRLRAVFTDETYWGLPEEHCVVMAQPDTGRQVLDQMYDTARQATDALVIYYAGHGLADPVTDELCLALPDTNPDVTHTSLRYEEVRRMVLHPDVHARRKVVVLDCCYSGRALIASMSAASDLADQASVEGSYLLTASAETSKALSPADEEYTAFTGELIDVLTTGVPGGPALLDMDTVFRRVRMRLVAKTRPQPQQRNRNDGAQIALVRNVAAAPSAPAETIDPLWGVPEMPAGPLRDLRDELRQLHVEAGRPRPHTIESIIGTNGGAVSWTTIYQLLLGEDPQPDWAAVAHVVRALGGEPAAFKNLWELTVPTPVPDESPQSDDHGADEDPDKDYQPHFMEAILGASLYEEEFYQEFGQYFDKAFFNEITRDKSAMKPAVRRRLIEHAANMLAWNANDPYLVETARARAIDGLLAFTEQKRRAQLTELARLAAADPTAARGQLGQLADSADGQAVILAALGSRDASAAAGVLLDHVHCHTSDALTVVTALAAMRNQGSRAVFRHLARVTPAELAAVFMLVEAGAPAVRDDILRLLGSVP